MPDEGVVWRDGRLIPFADATAHVLSHMAARGSQVFDVLLAVPGAAGHCGVGLRPHVARFVRSAELMGMGPVGEIGDLERAVADTVTANLALGAIGGADGTDTVVVKLVAAWAEEAVGLMPARLEPTVHVLSTPFAGDGPAHEIRSAVAVKSVAMPKMPAAILPPSLKVAAAYAPGVREHLQAQREGFDNIVMRTLDGDLAESTTSSMIVIRDGRVLAPPLDAVLDGITRRLVFDAAAVLGLVTEVRSIYWDEVTGADELLLSSTNNPVLPVARLDDVEIGGPGPVTTRLGASVSEVLRGEHALSDRWLTPLAPLASPG